MRVAVIGSFEIDESIDDVVHDVGKRLDDRGHTVVCGGLGGAMEAACRVHSKWVG